MKPSGKTVKSVGRCRNQRKECSTPEAKNRPALTGRCARAPNVARVRRARTAARTQTQNECRACATHRALCVVVTNVTRVTDGLHPSQSAEILRWINATRNIMHAPFLSRGSTTRGYLSALSVSRQVASPLLVFSLAGGWTFWRCFPRFGWRGNFVRSARWLRYWGLGSGGGSVCGALRWLRRGRR